jgi:hypothetical protein
LSFMSKNSQIFRSPEVIEIYFSRKHVINSMFNKTFMDDMSFSYFKKGP